MGMARVEVRDKGLYRKSRVGDGWLAAVQSPTAVTTDGALTLTAAQIQNGAALYTGLTGGQNLTTPTAAAILTALPGMNTGDSHVVSVTNTAAQDATLTAGDGNVTLAGFATVNANTRRLIITKTSPTTVTITAI